jgi:hypothetical protein
MKTSRLYLTTCLILSIIPFCSSFSQWQEIRTIYGGNPLKQIEETTDKLVGITDYQVYLANKTDFFWEEDTIFSQTPIWGIATSADTIFVLYADVNLGVDLLLKVSFDQGNSWQPSQFVAISGWGNMVLTYTNNQLVLTGMINGQNKIMTSLDLGGSWTSNDIDETIHEVDELLDKGGDHLLYRVVSFSETNYYTYSLSNETWHAIPTQENTNSFSEIFIFENRVYWAERNFNQVFIRSCTLNGSDVQIIHTMDDVGHLRGFIESNGIFACLISNNNSVLEFELHVSSDNGETFSLSNTFTNIPAWIDDKQLSTGETIISELNKLYIMSSDFQNYEIISDGLILNGIDYLTSINNSLWVVDFAKYFQRSDDNGLTFSSLPDSIGIPYGGIASKGDTLFFMTDEPNYEDDSPYGYRISFNNGLTSEEVLPIHNSMNINGNTQQAIIYNNKIYVCVADPFGAFPAFIQVSSDYGQTWQTNSSPEGLEGDFIECNNELYFYGGDLYRFNEANNSWTALNSPYLSDGNSEDSQLRKLGSNILVKNQDGQVILYLCEQSSWVNLGTYISDATEVGNISYGISNDTLYSSADFGLSWISTGISLPTDDSRNLTNHNGELLLYGGYSSSIWRMDPPAQISGLVYYDANSNGVHDIGEVGIPQILIHTQNSQNHAMTGPTGIYNFNYTGVEEELIVEPNNPLYTVVPQNLIVNGPGEFNFGIQIEGSTSDLMTDIIVYSPFRPGFATSATLHLSNLGNVVQGGELVVGLPENVTFTSASVEPISETGNIITFAIADLQAFESHQIQLNMLTSVMAVLGDTAILTATLSTETSDINTNNNQAIDSSIIVGSYDPNDKTCYRGELVTPTQLNNNNEFEYLIRFQNTGTFYAENVVIQDTISSYFDLSTMRIIASSDTMNVTFGDNNLVNFNFPLIFLPDSTTNEPESHGFVKYAIRTKPNLELGTVLKNTAYIYFDFNEPIITNTTETLYDLPNNIELNEELNVLVYPNPTNSTVKLMEYSSANVSVSLTDLSGKTVAMQTCINGELDLSKLNLGVYLGVIHTTNGQSARRFKVVKM